MAFPHIIAAKVPVSTLRSLRGFLLVLVKRQLSDAIREGAGRPFALLRRWVTSLGGQEKRRSMAEATARPAALSVATALASGGAGMAGMASPPLVTSPRNEFYVSQRAAEYEPSREDALSLEEQEILASIQELQLQLMQVLVRLIAGCSFIG